jgi:hypothetical protein
MMTGALKNPLHDVGGTCSRATPLFCHHAGYFGTAEGTCLVEGSPAYPAYRTRILAEVAQLRDNTHGSAGWYLDTVPLTNTNRFDPSDTIKGYLSSSYQAERDFLEQVAAEHPAGRYGLTREHAPDYVNAQVPHVMNWAPVLYDAADQNIQRVPLHALVYHEWVQTSVAIAPGDDPVAAKTKLARALVFGQQPLLSAPYYQADSIRGPADGIFEAYVKAMAQARRALKVWLVDGELLAPVEHAAGADATSETLTAGWCNGHLSSPTCSTALVGAGQPLPSIQGAWWRGSDGSYALIAANVDPTDTSVAYVVPVPGFAFSPPVESGTALEAVDERRWRITLAGGKVMMARLSREP